jgi:hypothetical protein
MGVSVGMFRYVHLRVCTHDGRTLAFLCRLAGGTPSLLCVIPSYCWANMIVLGVPLVSPIIMKSVITSLPVPEMALASMA